MSVSLSEIENNLAKKMFLLTFEVMDHIYNKIRGMTTTLFKVGGTNIPVAILPGATSEPRLQHW